MAKRVPVSATQDEQRITLPGYESNDVWLCRDANGSGWLVIADAVCIAIGESTPEAAIEAATAYVRDNAAALAREIADVRRRAGTR